MKKKRQDTLDKNNYKYQNYVNEKRWITASSLQRYKIGPIKNLP